MKVSGTILIAWWVYVNTLVLVPTYATPYRYLASQWVPRERFLHQEFCEFKARQLRREGQEATCLYVND